MDHRLHCDSDRGRINRYRSEIWQAVTDRLDNPDSAHRFPAETRSGRATFVAAREMLRRYPHFRSENLQMHENEISCASSDKGAAYELLADLAWHEAITRGEMPSWYIDPVSIRILAEDLEGKLPLDVARAKAGEHLDRLRSDQPSGVQLRRNYVEIRNYTIKGKIGLRLGNEFCIGRPLPEATLAAIPGMTLDEIVEIPLLNGLGLIAKGTSILKGVGNAAIIILDNEERREFIESKASRHEEHDTDR